MGGAPVTETIRPGVTFTPDAAASFRRAEASWGRNIRCNSTYRDYGLQLSMWQAWEAYAAGRGPYPGHSRAIHPDKSVHCQARALDTPDYAREGFIAHMAEHGWIRTAATDPTEQHHFEYQWWRDTHRNDPAPADAGAAPFNPEEEELMSARDDIIGRIDRLEASIHDRREVIIAGIPDLGMYVVDYGARTMWNVAAGQAGVTEAFAFRDFLRDGLGLPWLDHQSPSIVAGCRDITGDKTVAQAVEDGVRRALRDQTTES